MRLLHCLVILGCASSIACGGSQKPAEDTKAEASDSEKADDAASEDSDKKSDGVADSDEKKSEAQSEAKEEPKKEAESSSGPAIKRTPKDLLTAPDVIFMFSFNASDVKNEAEARCDKAVKDDPKKRAACMTKEKAKIDIDGMRFKQERGNWYWMLIRRKGKTLVNLHKIPIEFDKETDNSVVLKPVGKDEGTQRGKGPGATKVQVPNEYQIEIDDPEHGKMVFEAKIGLTEPNQR